MNYKRRLHRRWRSLVIAVLMIVLGGWLAVSCGRQQQKDEAVFDLLDRAVQDVNPAQLGKVVLDRKSGSADPLSERATRRMAVLAKGMPDELAAKAGDILATTDFEKAGLDLWQRWSKDQLVLVRIFTQGPGSTLEGYDGTVSAGQALLVLSFEWGGKKP